MLVAQQRLVAGFVFIGLAAIAAAEPASTDPQQIATPAAASTREASEAIGTFRVAEDLKVELFAANPLLGNPVAFCLDEQGRVLVAESYRFNRGTEENRTRPFLLEDDLQIRTLGDRLAMFHKWKDKFDGGLDYFTRHADLVRLVEDRDGDGRADRSQVFAGGFNNTLDGLAAGLIARDGDVYFTCIPNLWRLRDYDGDGKADLRQVVSRGYGVNAAFLGHDLHGLVWGPDGKLYFSVGDRGFHVQSREGRLFSGPRNGGVFRINPNGSELELVARGMRNPQELAFDAYGNLFAADNNCDKGDKSRLVYVMDGGNSGWNMAYQTIPEPYLTGPWHAENLWHLPHEGQPAWIVPPVGALGAGPSGFAYYPGVGLPERYDDHFFMCNYTGNGGLESFAVRAQGAGFVTVDYHDVVKPIRATDVEFGYDGKIYLSDWVEFTWDGGGVGKGRIYTIHSPDDIKRPAVGQTRKRFAAGFAKLSPAELIDLLSHADMRVRLRAQYAIARRGPASAATLIKLLESSTNQFARLHALWGLGQIARGHAEFRREQLPAHLAGLIDDDDLHVRIQAAKLAGELRLGQLVPQLIARLSDQSPRVQSLAALALARLADPAAAEPLVAMLRANNDADPYLRHAGVMGWAACASDEAVVGRWQDESSAVRLAAVLVLRRRGDARIARFLDDAEPVVVMEAARAINDVPIDGALDALASRIERVAALSSPVTEPLVRRAINAAFRRGTTADAAAIARQAANSKLSGGMRLEAVAALADWQKPSPRDRVTGFWRPLPSRELAPLRRVLEPEVTRLLATAEGPLEAAVAKLVGTLEIQVNNETFRGWLADTSRSPNTRVAALELLATRKDPQLEKLVDATLADKEPELRAAARDLLGTLDVGRAERELAAVLADSSRATLSERQRAFASLASLGDRTGQRQLADWTARLADGEVEPELQLDVWEAAKRIDTESVNEARARFEASLSADDPLAKFRVAVAGGNDERGKQLFRSHAAAQCIRCHKIRGFGGEAGPDLTKIGKELKREQLLESLVAPHARIRPGFASVVLQLADGRNLAGILRKETSKHVELTTPGGQTLRVAVTEIEARSRPKSAMPEMGRVLKLAEIRALVAYLATLR